MFKAPKYKNTHIRVGKTVWCKLFVPGTKYVTAEFEFMYKPMSYFLQNPHIDTTSMVDSQSSNETTPNTSLNNQMTINSNHSSDACISNSSTLETSQSINISNRSIMSPEVSLMINRRYEMSSGNVVNQIGQYESMYTGQIGDLGSNNEKNRAYLCSSNSLAASNSGLRSSNSLITYVTTKSDPMNQISADSNQQSYLNHQNLASNDTFVSMNFNNNSSMIDIMEQDDNISDIRDLLDFPLDMDLDILQNETSINTENQQQASQLVNVSLIIDERDNEDFGLGDLIDPNFINHAYKR